MRGGWRTSPATRLDEPNHPPLRSLLLLLHDAVLMLLQNPYLGGKMGLFGSRDRASMRLFQSAGIPAVLALLLPEPSQGLLLARLLASNLVGAYNHHVGPLGGVRAALAPLLGHALVGVLLPLLATRWLARQHGGSVKVYLPRTLRRWTSTAIKVTCRPLWVRLGSPTECQRVCTRPQVHAMEPEDLTPSNRGQLLGLLSGSAAPDEHVSIQVFRQGPRLSARTGG